MCLSSSNNDVNNHKWIQTKINSSCVKLLFFSSSRPTLGFAQIILSIGSKRQARSPKLPQKLPSIFKNYIITFPNSIYPLKVLIMTFNVSKHPEAQQASAVWRYFGAHISRQVPTHGRPDRQKTGPLQSADASLGLVLCALFGV